MCLKADALISSYTDSKIVVHEFLGVPKTFSSSTKDVNEKENPTKQGYHFNKVNNNFITLKYF
jgi:predicted metallopeptidase